MNERAPSAAEALSKVLRAHALEPHETSPHRLFRAEPAARRDPLGGQVGLGEQLTGHLDAQPLDRARERQTRRLAALSQSNKRASSAARMTPCPPATVNVSSGSAGSGSGSVANHRPDVARICTPSGATTRML